MNCWFNFKESRKRFVPIVGTIMGRFWRLADAFLAGVAGRAGALPQIEGEMGEDLSIAATDSVLLLRDPEGIKRSMYRSPEPSP